jgi:anti-sigma factor RsiW
MSDTSAATVVMRRTTAIHARGERSLDRLSSTDCELMRLRISARLDGELSEPHQAGLARHLDRCDACARFALALAGLTEVLRADWVVLRRRKTEVKAHVGKAGRRLLLLGALAVILGAGAGNHARAGAHARCHSVWGVATVCDARA